MPVLGRFLFGIYDRLQKISPFFPFRDLSKSNWVVMYLKSRIGGGFGSSLVDYIKTARLPIITTHWLPALIADYNGLKDIYLIVTDADCNRVWVSHDPKNSNIDYIAPCNHVLMRLKQYGVPEDNIHLMGFPLPKENLGKNLQILKKDLSARMKNLDPNKAFISKYSGHIRSKLGRYFNIKPKRPLTLAYMVGGAGAEKELGIEIVKSLKSKIQKGKIAVNLVAGSRLDVLSYFKEKLKKEKLSRLVGNGVDIIYTLGRNYYFQKINELLRTTDIIWTKPSELSFYCALGLPVIIAPPVGAHEEENKRWLERTGAGFVQGEPKYTDEWLFYWIYEGRFAEAAWNGFIDARKKGTYDIEKLIRLNQQYLNTNPRYKGQL